MAKIKLTKSVVDTAQAQTCDVELRDTLVPGFLCKITPTGRKVFMVQYRTNSGVRRKPALGQFGELTVEQARSLAQDWLAEVRRGGDPGLDKAEARKAPTVKELCGRFMDDHSKLHNKPSTKAGYQYQIDNFVIPAFGSKKVHEVTRHDITALMKRMERSPTQANRVLSLVRKMFNLAELWGYRPDGSNPCRHVPKYPEKGSTRLITDEQMVSLFAYLDKAEAEGLEHPIYLLADELRDRGYLVIDGVDGKAHYVALNTRDELANYPAGAVVEVKGSADVRAADKNIAALASDGLYRTDHHLAIAQGQAMPGRDPQEVVAAHVRRLEALRRAGIVERVAEGLWKVPDDLPEQGRRYDAQRLGGVAVELKSHLPIERQARVIGATWLDQQLIGGGSGLGDLGFGGEAKQAMQQRADFLAEQGLAERRGQRVILARNLLGTLRNRELAQAAKDIAGETGLEHRPVADGQRVAGIYRRSVMLASGRYAMLDDGMGFSLVPWKPVIEQRLGQQLAATVRGGGVSWEIGRQKGMSII